MGQVQLAEYFKGGEGAQDVECEGAQAGHLLYSGQYPLHVGELIYAGDLGSVGLEQHGGWEPGAVKCCRAECDQLCVHAEVVDGLLPALGDKAVYQVVTWWEVFC